MKTQKTYCGYITIIGKVNVGKSTFLNKIIGKKISISSKKKYTTQNNIIGIITQNSYQLIYVDTPGVILDTQKKNIIYEQKESYKIVKLSSLILFIIDKIFWMEDYQIIFDKIKKNNIPIIIIINKIDKINKKIILLPFIDFLKNQRNVIDIIPLSVKKIKSLNFLNNIIKNYLPKKKHIYPASYFTTNSEFFTISEIIREQLILFLGDELPNEIKVIIESCKKNKTEEMHITAIIQVKNIRHKKIVIGYQGKKIKKISIISRKKIEQEFHNKIHLFLWVK
ncbi:GTPase Era [Buchnera aphidicola (Macrosiphoniella sanborni)]|uniref:GTPase Era n=1 Tax=Buchnera aphidicola (Macrosiphoniella sanborni) TaxID=1241865 RepID=A0A4D6Y418_9GAMM|nr:GTPase Era [Buchnera aphidicola]QCI23799.1 GTPase Era [Buchnera aphidicola (Macrosiphoniella sanborni)]